MDISGTGHDWLTKTHKPGEEINFGGSSDIQTYVSSNGEVGRECLFTASQGLRGIKGSWLQEEQKELDLHAVGGRSAEISAEGCVGCKKFTWVQCEAG